MTLPLNSDNLTAAMVAQFNSGVFVNTFGTLDTFGGGTSAIVTPPGLIPPGNIGVQMHFAHVLFDDSMLVVRASNATRVTIVP